MMEAAGVCGWVAVQAVRGRGPCPERGCARPPAASLPSARLPLHRAPPRRRPAPRATTRPAGRPSARPLPCARPGCGASNVRNTSQHGITGCSPAPRGGGRARRSCLEAAQGVGRPADRQRRDQPGVDLSRNLRVLPARDASSAGRSSTRVVQGRRERATLTFRARDTVPVGIVEPPHPTQAAICRDPLSV